MVQSYRLSRLAPVLLLLGFFGCNSQTGQQYQDFREITAANEASTTGDEQVPVETPAGEPLRAPRAEVPGVAAAVTNGSANAGELVPLRAVKPVYGQSSRELSDNIENVADAAQAPREIRVLVKAPSFRKEDGAFRVSYDDIDLLKVLNMEPVPPDAVTHFPDWLAGLDGKRIRIRGFMYPPFRETDIEAFVLARDNQICCFGRNPKVYDLIAVEMKKGVTTDYILNRPFDVVGTFRIRPDVEGGEWYNLYEITDAVVIDN